MGILKELKNRGVRIIGTDSNPMSAGLFLCDKGFVVPNAIEENYIDEMLKICVNENVDLILPGPEEEMIKLSKNKERFAKNGSIVFCPDYQTVKICSDKLETYKTFKKLGIETPIIYNDQNPKFPCIIKPRFGRGSVDVHKISNQNEFSFYFNKVKTSLVQEFIGGDEYSVDVFSDLHGVPLSIIPRRRIETESGISTKSITLKDEKIIQVCKLIVKHLKLIGPSCIQCIKDQNKVAFIEINTRFGGGSVLSMKSNPSIIENLIKIVKGISTKPHFYFKENLAMLRYYDEVFIDEKEIN